MSARQHMSRIGNAECPDSRLMPCDGFRHLMSGRFAGRAGIRGAERHGKSGRAGQRGDGLRAIVMEVL